MRGFVKSKIADLLALDTFEIQKGLVDGVSVVSKSGRNPTITSATAPEDMWNGSSVYTGFPTGSPETVEFFSSNAGDTGVITYIYLPTNTSTVWLSATVTLNGITPVVGASAYRVHTASYASGSGTAFNLGTITCRHTTTTANIFFQMPIGTSQTYVCAYTIPYGCTGFLKSASCDINTTNSVAMQGALWIRASGASPRLRRNFNVSNAVGHKEQNLYMPLSQMTDITMRITASSSALAQTVLGSFDIILIDEVL